MLALSGAVACSSDESNAASNGDPPGDSGPAAVVSNDSGSGTDAVDGLLVTLDDGQVQGDMSGEARRFLKIPFAKPPLGELRWKAPVRNDPWTGVLYETEFVQGCPQLADQGSPASNNEDCLYLNVWSPEPAPERAPVLVWIHGGGNFSGSAGIPIPATTGTLWYDGQFFASRHRVLLVTINYRLGPLGFFAHPALADEGEPVGNQGLHDQRLALEWVRDNIAKFGGDPNNVTIFGESAGAADVCYHVASPGSRGLFHRAVSQSGGCTMRSMGPEQTLEGAGAQMVAYAEAVGCAAGTDQLACLRDAAVETVLANANQPMPGAGRSDRATGASASWSTGPTAFYRIRRVLCSTAGRLPTFPTCSAATTTRAPRSSSAPRRS